MYTCTIITTKPNELMEDIHDRMPVILTDENEKEWLNPKNTDLDYLQSLLQPYDADEKRIVVGKPELVNQSDVKPFKFDKRGNVSAIPFLRKVGIDFDKLPQRYYLIGDGEASKQPYLAYPSHTYAFQLDADAN